MKKTNKAPSLIMFKKCVKPLSKMKKWKSESEPKRVIKHKKTTVFIHKYKNGSIIQLVADELGKNAYLTVVRTNDDIILINSMLINDIE